MLNTSKAWSANFTSSGSYHRHHLLFSLSGVPDRHDLRVRLDNNDLRWTPETDIGIDRWHYDIHLNGTLAGGEHKVTFALLNKDLEGIAQLCSVEMLEYGDGAEYDVLSRLFAMLTTMSQICFNSWTLCNFSDVSQNAPTLNTRHL
jgi:hypothetical protein